FLIPHSPFAFPSLKPRRFSRKLYSAQRIHLRFAHRSGLRKGWPSCSFMGGNRKAAQDVFGPTGPVRPADVGQLASCAAVRGAPDRPVRYSRRSGARSDASGFAIVENVSRRCRISHVAVANCGEHVSQPLGETGGTEGARNRFGRSSTATAERCGR